MHFCSGVDTPLMYFCSGQPMHFCSGVDSHRNLASTGTEYGLIVSVTIGVIVKVTPLITESDRSLPEHRDIPVGNDLILRRLWTKKGGERCVPRTI